MKKKIEARLSLKALEVLYSLCHHLNLESPGAVLNRLGDLEAFLLEEEGVPGIVEYLVYVDKLEKDQRGEQ